MKGDWCIVLDRLIYKNLGSLNRALGRNVKVDAHTLYIKFTSGRVVLRVSSDVVICSKNENDQLCVDILDLLLWAPEGEHLPQAASQHDLFLPQINIEDENNQSVVNTDNNVPLSTNAGDDIQIDTRYNQPEQEKKDPAEGGHSSTTLRHSSRVGKPSFKFLSHFAESDSD